MLGYHFANPSIVTPDTPIDAFFEAFFQAGPYYTFVGTVQVLAAVLLLFPRTAALGTVLYLPIVVNTFVITASMDVGGTVVVVGLMLLACLFLLCWYYPRWKGLLFASDLRVGATAVHPFTRRDRHRCSGCGTVRVASARAHGDIVRPLRRSYQARE